MIVRMKDWILERLRNVRVYRWVVVVVGNETGIVHPITFTRCMRRATAQDFINRQKARFPEANSLTHWDVRRWPDWQEHLTDI